MLVDIRQSVVHVSKQVQQVEQRSVQSQAELRLMRQQLLVLQDMVAQLVVAVGAGATVSANGQPIGALQQDASHCVSRAEDATTDVAAVASPMQALCTPAKGYHLTQAAAQVAAVTAAAAAEADADAAAELMQRPRTMPGVAAGAGIGGAGMAEQDASQVICRLHRRLLIKYIMVVCMPSLVIMSRVT